MASVKGLVSFPVEITYVCRIPALAAKGELAVPLPRIDLPIAYAWCEASLPRNLETKRWRGAFRPVDVFSNQTAQTYFGYGRGEAAAGYRPEDRPTTGLITGLLPRDTDFVMEDAEDITSAWSDQTANRLGRNYWVAGKELYEKGKYEQAAEALSQVEKFAGGTAEADNAKRLLSNIWSVQGKLKVRWMRGIC